MAPGLAIPSSLGKSHETCREIHAIVKEVFPLDHESAVTDHIGGEDGNAPTAEDADSIM